MLHQRLQRLRVQYKDVLKDAVTCLGKRKRKKRNKSGLKKQLLIEVSVIERLRSRWRRVISPCLVNAAGCDSRKPRAPSRLGSRTRARASVAATQSPTRSLIAGHVTSSSPAKWCKLTRDALLTDIPWLNTAPQYDGGLSVDERQQKVCKFIHHTISLVTCSS